MVFGQTEHTDTTKGLVVVTGVLTYLKLLEIWQIAAVREMFKWRGYLQPLRSAFQASLIRSYRQSRAPLCHDQYY